MKNLVKRFAKDESGATAIEYGLIAAGDRVVDRQQIKPAVRVRLRAPVVPEP